MLAVDHNSRWIIVSDRQFDEAYPRLFGGINAGRSENIVVNLQMRGLDVTVETCAIEPVHGALHQLFSVFPVLAIFPPIIDN